MTSESCVKRDICKTWTGHLQIMQTQIRQQRTRLLVRLCTVCLYYRKLRVKWNSLSPLSRPISQPTPRDNRSPVLSCFDLSFWRRTLTGKVTLTKGLYHFSEKGSSLKGNNFAPSKAKRKSTKWSYLQNIASRKHACIILTPWNPTFYIVKLGFTGVYIILLISLKKPRL